jgi:nonribosomal peptide synthetase DhbF
VPEFFQEQEITEEELKNKLQEAAGYGFDLEREIPLRVWLWSLGEQEHVVMVLQHHIATDGWSMAPLGRDLGRAYKARNRGEEPGWSELPVQYADYSLWQAEQLGEEGDEQSSLRRELEYWKERLAGLPEEIELPRDRKRPEVSSYRGENVNVTLSGEVHRKLLEVAREQGATLFMVLQAGLAGLLTRLGGGTDVVLGSPIAGRSEEGVNELVGFFVNTLVLRTDTSGDPSLAELVRRVREEDLNAYAHQEVPFEYLVEAVNPARSLNRHPLFQVMLVLQNAAELELELEGLKVKLGENGATAPAKFDLTFDFSEDRHGGEARGIVGQINYAVDLFERETVEKLGKRLERVLEGMCEDAGQRIGEIEILGEEERREMVKEWNATATEYPKRCVQELFEEQVERSADAVAVVYEDEQLSYGELNRRANQLAHYLRELGVGAETRVAICLERSLEMVIGMLGVLKAGGAYVPLDPEYPVERLRFMLEDSGSVVLLTQGDLAESFSFTNSVPRLLDMTRSDIWRFMPDSNLDRSTTGISPENLAYIIYTSGSTGNPKGVLVEHANECRLFHTTEDYFHFDAHDVWTLFHSYAFDFSVWELGGALFYGGRLIIVSRDITRSPDDFYNLVCRQRVTILNQTPSAFRQMVASQGRIPESHALRQVIFGGEALEVAILKPWYKQNAQHQTQLINMYGITETTVHVTYRQLEQADTLKQGGSPIGRRIPDLRMYILNENLRPVPVAVRGELYVGGAGVARGYLNRPELAAEKFVPDLFADEPGARMYRTGDVGRWLPDGQVEFLGRNDFQVKIRGFRIELGEIEVRLAEHDQVSEAAVLAREDAPGDKRLVAYYTSHGEPDGVTAEQLRSHLSDRLPDYMIPAAYVRLKAMPLTYNGKLDRKALPLPQGDAYAAAGYEAPQGDRETRLAAIWSEVLKVERIGRHDNFFELGGHSLLAITTIERMRSSGFSVNIRTLFVTPTLAQLAAIKSADGPEIHVPENLIPIHHTRSDANLEAKTEVRI